MAERAIATTRRPATRRICRQRSVAELRAKRYDPPPSRHAGPTPRPGVRSGTVRVDTATYRRRRRFVGLAVAAAVTVLSLGAQAALTGSGSGPAFALLFTPWVLMPLATGCLVGLVKSGSGGRRPASPSPAAGSATVETPMAHAA